MTLFFNLLAVFFSVTLATLIGEILAHLIIYRRVGRAKKRNKRKSGGPDSFSELIKQ